MQQDYGTSRGGSAGSSGSSGWWHGQGPSSSQGSSYGQGPTSSYGGKERFGGGGEFEQQQRFKEGEFSGSGIKGQQHQGDFNWVVKDMSSYNVNPSELMHVHMGLVLAGHCYIKEHLKMLLLGGGHGVGPESMTSPACKVIKQWHDNVTVPNLHILTDVSKKLGLPLPFAEPLEQREHCLKRCFQQIGRIEPVLKDHEALLDIKLAAMNTSHFLLQCINTAACQHLKDAFKECFTNICKNIDPVKEALHNTCVPCPIVKSVAVFDTGVTSHTGSVKDKGEWGYGQQSGISGQRGSGGLEGRHDVTGSGGYDQERFGQQQRPFDTQRDVGRGYTRQIPVT